jgi:hypothetical protein
MMGEMVQICVAQILCSCPSPANVVTLDNVAAAKVAGIT